MKNKIIIFLVLASFSGFGQGIYRTLPNVTNTADSMKPVSTVQKAAIVQKLQTVSTISALQGFTDATIATFDGSQWNKKSGNVASNGGAFAGTIINVSTLFYWERKCDVITPEMFGGDVLSSDATVQLQQMMDNANGKIMDGNNRLYIVTSLNVSSNSTVKNFQLKTKAGTINFVSPITINGTGGFPKTNIYLYNIQIDGNRANQTNMPASGFAEDGGRGGFRTVGYTSNLIIENCSANYTANDAISFVSSTSVTNSDADFCFKNIKITNFTGNWNRRHGMSIDCLDGLEMNNTIFRYNGKDLNTVDAQSIASRGARLPSGFLYGNGVDFEDYGVGTAIQNINIQNINTSNNSYAGFVMTSPVNPTSTNFYTRKNIKINNIISTQGDDILVGSPASVDYSALKVAAQVSVSSLGYTYENIDIINAKLTGRLELRGITGATYNGSINFSNGFYQMLVNDSKDIYVQSAIKGTSKYTNLGTTTNYNEVYNSVSNKFKLVTNLVDVNAPVGNVALVNGSVTVSNTSVLSGSSIMLSVNGIAGTPGFIYAIKNVGVGFTIYSTSSTDNSNINWLIIN